MAVVQTCDIGIQLVQKFEFRFCKAIGYKSKEHNSSWEADSRSVSPEIPCPFTEPKSALSCSQKPVTGPCPEAYESSQHPHTPLLQCVF
jgi:hypothetical protein